MRIVIIFLTTLLCLALTGPPPAARAEVGHPALPRMEREQPPSPFRMPAPPPSVTFPDPSPAGTPAGEAEEPPPVLPGDARLTATHAYLSRNIEALSDRIDAFFGTDRAFDESSGTYVQVRGSVIYRKNGDLDFDGNVRAKLDLPNLKEKLSLVIESEDEDLNAIARREGITTGAPSVTEQFENKNVSASLQYILREAADWDVRLQPGIKLHWPPETFLRLRMRRTQELSEKWLSRVTLTPGWYDPRGWEVRLRHDFDRNTGQGSLLRIGSEAIWLMKNDRNLGLVQNLAFSHPLGKRTQMGYEAGVTFETHPTFWDTAYFASIRCRRNLHRGWIFLELKPQLLFQREDDFKPEPSFALTLEMIFGARTMGQEPN